MNIRFFENKAIENGYKCIGGIDEAGRGPLAGPVVAACVVLPVGFCDHLIVDSKKLTEKKRDIAYDMILDNAIALGIGTVNSDVIDRINILRATYLAMKLAVEDANIELDYLLVDGNPVSGLPVKSESIVKGDLKSISIAAASIIAKVTRDRIMLEIDREFPQYAFAKHKGYGTKEHLKALDLYGVCKYHRFSFAPVYARSLQCRLTGLE